MTEDAEAVLSDLATSTIEPPVDDTPNQVMIGVRIRESSRIYHVSAPAGQVLAGEYVVIERGRGEQLARVVTVADDDASASPIPRDVHPIIRLADADDRDHANAQSERADQILQDMRTIAVQDDMGMYPVAIELNLDGDRGSVWFQAPEHIDFRPLLNRIQEQHDVDLNMRQTNQRERARLVDGYDICGLRLCCSSWMTDFPHVGIRVAKDQDLSLNPDSISGVCGRLLCCLTFEHEVYREMRGSLPRVGKRVSTPAGMGKVIKLNVLKQMVTITLDDHPQRVDVPAAEIGLAVRTEDAPNQALVEAERTETEERAAAEALRDAAAPAEVAALPSKRRRRKRSGGDSASGADAPSAEQTQPSSERAQSQPKPSRRRRRRKAPIVNQTEEQRGSARDESDVGDASSAAQPAQSSGRRRRRRSSRPRKQPDQSDE